MYAIVRIGGRQFRVEPEMTLQVPRLAAAEGETVTLDTVLLLHDGSEVRVGAPVVEGGAVTAEVIRHGRAPKVAVFKKRRRKNYRRNRSHRQPLTEIRITGITA